MFSSQIYGKLSTAKPGSADKWKGDGLDALRRDVASLKPRQQASRPTWLLFAAAGVALAAWVLTPEDPYAAALAS